MGEQETGAIVSTMSASLSQICLICKQSFVLSPQFAIRDKNRSSGWYPHCKPCAYAEQKARYLTVRGRLRSLLTVTKNYDRKKGWQSNLTIEHLLGLWETQNGKCIRTGHTFVLEKSNEFRRDPHTVSISRIDNSKPHAIGNVELTTIIYNLFCNEWGHEIAIETAKAMIDIE